jgi:anti-sigma factor RsiW
MTCREACGLAGSFLDGELPEEICDGIQRHLLRCDSCRAEVDSLRMAVDLLRTTQQPPAPGEEFLTRALATVAESLGLEEHPAGAPGQLVLLVDR